MAKFDIINAAIGAYKQSWDARHYLLKLAAVPVALKLFCFTIAQVYAGGSSMQDGGFMLFMLIMVPALIAEGWMLAHFVRYLVLGQTWPFRATGDMDKDLAVLSERARGILSGMIVFVLINMGVGFLNTLVSMTMMPYLPSDAAATAVNIPPPMALLSLVLIIFMFWGFRLLWLYIPFALNMNPKSYFSGIKGTTISINMIGVWLLCFFPFIIVLKILSVIVAAPLTLSLGPGVGNFVLSIFSVLADTLKSIVTTAGITLGLREVFTPRKTGR